MLIGLVIEIGIESSSRWSFHKSLAALLENFRAEKQAGRDLSSAEAVRLISGWPSVSEQNVAARKQIEYRWPSLIWDLRIELLSDAKGAVAAMMVGNRPVSLSSWPDQFARGQATDAGTKLAAWQSRARPSDLGAAIVLGQRGDGFAPNSNERGRLVREIVRQAILIAARDELNLATRDSVMEDIAPDDGNAILPQFVTVITVDGERRVTINVEQESSDGVANLIATHEFQLTPGPLLDSLVVKAEAMSRNEFVTTLKKAGLAGNGHQYLPSAIVDETIAGKLNEFEILSQFIAVRALHAEIRKSGESPERLADLARGYAQLSALSQFLWSPAYKVFAARGLLYSERLIEKAGRSPFALWQRAYVRALVGLHTSANEDLAAAASAAQGADAPDWAPAVEAFCRGDLAGLSKASGLQVPATLPLFLRLLATASTEISTVRVQSAARLLRSQPDCELAFDIAVDESPLEIQRQMAGQALTQFSSTLRDWLESSDDIPEDVRKLRNEPADDLKSEMEARAQLIAALQNSASIGRDVGEPSYAALAHLIQETSLVQACRLLFVEKYCLGVDTSETLAAVKPVLKGHRYESFVDLHAWDQRLSYRSFVSLYESLDREQLELGANHMLDLMHRHWTPSHEADAAILPLGDALVRHSDRTFGDLARASRSRASIPVKQRVVAALRELSPDSGLAVAAAVRHDWDRTQSSAGEWEIQFADDIGVQGALAETYTAQKRFDDAVRCRKRQLELLPEQTVYRALARLYKVHGDEQLWFETAKRSLEAPSYGLEHSETHADLAYYHMHRQEWDAARPHADQAAQSESGRGLLCAAEFYERIDDWGRANLLRRRNAERYADQGADMDWYFWCRATGHGDVSAARRMVQTRIEKLKNSQIPDEHDRLGLYYILEEQPSEALDAFRTAGQRDTEEAYHCLHAALLADELGQSALRNEMLQQAHAWGVNRNENLAAIVSAFQNCLDAGSDRLDLNAIDWVISHRPAAGGPTNEFYFVGKFLALRGREAEALEYLQRSAASSESGNYNSRMAMHALQKAGIALGQRRNAEFDEPISRRLDLLRKANERRDAGDWETALPAYTELLDANPDFAHAWFERGLGFRDREEFDPAIFDLTRALELVPGCALFLVTRGQALECIGQYAAAIKDYEDALRIDPRSARARYNLAFLRAACPEPQFRDSKQARAQAEIVQRQPDVSQDLRLALLAAANAEAGAFDKAIQLQNQSLQVTPSERLTAARERLQMYQRSEPYHRKPAWWRLR